MVNRGRRGFPGQYFLIVLNRADESHMNTIRSAASRWLAILSIALLAYCGIVLSIAWARASRDGEIPKQWGRYEGNHGPWRYYDTGRSLVWHAITIPFWAFCVAAAAFLARPSSGIALLAGICLISLFFVTSTHFWLVD